MIQFFLDFYQSKDVYNAHKKQDEAFFHACKNKKTDLIKYFVFDCDIKIKSNIKELFKTNSDVEIMFMEREQKKKKYNKLRKQLEINAKNNNNIEDINKKTNRIKI